MFMLFFTFDNGDDGVSGPVDAWLEGSWSVVEDWDFAFAMTLMRSVNEVGIIFIEEGLTTLTGESTSDLAPDISVFLSSRSRS